MYRSPKISPCVKCQNHGKIVVSHCPYFSCQCKSCKQTDILADLKIQHQQIIRGFEPGGVEKTFKDSKEKLTSEKTFQQKVDSNKKRKSGKTLLDSKEKLTIGNTSGQKSLQDSKEEPTNVRSCGQKSFQAPTEKVASKRKREAETSQSSKEKLASRSKAKHKAPNLVDHDEKLAVKIKIEDVRSVDLVDYKNGVVLGENENCLDKVIKKETGDCEVVTNENDFAQDIKVDIGNDDDKNENGLLTDIQGEYSKYFKMESGECEVDKNDNSVAKFVEGDGDGECKVDKYEDFLVRDIQQYLAKERRLCKVDKEDYRARDVKKGSGQCEIDFVKLQSQENFIIKSEYIENEEIKLEPANDELKLQKCDTALESINYCCNFFEKESLVEPIIEVSDKGSHQRINDHEQSMDLFLEAIKMLNNVIKPS